MNPRTRPKQTSVPDPFCGPSESWNAIQVPNEAELRGYLASHPWGFLTHYSKTRYSQPCAKTLTKGVLPCRFCKALQGKWRTYTGVIMDRSWDKTIIVAGDQFAREARLIPLWSPIVITRGKGKTSPTRIHRVTDQKDPMWAVFDLIHRKEQADLWPEILRLWGDREIAEHFGYKLVNSQGDVSDTESGTPIATGRADPTPTEEPVSFMDILKGIRFADPPRSESNGTRHK